MYWKLQISHVKFKDYQREKYMNQIFEKKGTSENLRLTPFMFACDNGHFKNAV